MNFYIMAFATSKETKSGNKAYFYPVIYPNNKYFDCEGWSKIHLDITTKYHKEGYTLSLKSFSMTEKFK